MQDPAFLVDMFETNVAYLRQTWQMLGRPIYVIPGFSWMLGANSAVSCRCVHVGANLGVGSCSFVCFWNRFEIVCIDKLNVELLI